jgi:heptosyltransferase-2
MKSILVVKFGAIGDVVMAIAAVRALVEEHDTVDWLCGPAVAPLLACYPWIDPIHADDRALFHGGTVSRLREIVRIWMLLGRRRYDLCATLYYDARYRILTLPVRAGRKVHLDREDRNRRILPGRPHSAELVRILLPEEDGYALEQIAPLFPTLLPPSPLPPRRNPRIALVPAGASNMLRQQTLRRWPVERYAALAQHLLARGYEVVLIGGPDDLWARPAFAHLAGLHDTIGQLTLPQVVAAFEDSDLAVSHDTGPMHLASVTHASILALFGPTDPGSFLPRRPGVRAIWGGEHLSCRPCYDGQNFAPCQHNGCMREIGVDMVLSQIEILLAERASGPKPWLILLPSTISEAKA